MKTKLLRGLVLVLLGYLALVAVRFIYLESGGPEVELYEGSRSVAARMPPMEPADVYQNYATISYKGAGGVQVDQKYEKIGRVSSTTDHFIDDEKLARSAIEDFHGIIQGEQVHSANGSRALSFVIGVPPGGFDTAVEDLKKIGTVESFSVTKNDKTNEYLKMRAKRVGLEKTRDALAGLKGQGGKIDELVKLEREILEIEQNIQDLGVQLGQFDQVNELCTVEFSLAEKAAAPEGRPHLAYFVSALEWAAKTYLAILASVILGMSALVLGVLLAIKAKELLASEAK